MSVTEGISAGYRKAEQDIEKKLGMSVEAALEVIEDFRKCDAFALRMEALLLSSDPKAFTGTVSDRLTRSFKYFEKVASLRK